MRWIAGWCSSGRSPSSTKRWPTRRRCAWSGGRADVAVVSSNEMLADHEISPFVVNLENEGRLSQRGRFRTSFDDLKALLANHLPVARERWKMTKRDTMDIAIYAHGGLTDEHAAAATARAWIPHRYTQRIFPIFLMWETGAVQTQHVPGRHARRGGDRRRRTLAALQGAVRGVEGPAARGPCAVSGRPDVGRDEAERGRAHGPRGSGYRAAVRSVSRQGRSFCVAGRSPAPDRPLGRRDRAQPAQRAIRLFIANLTDAAERGDDTCKPYGHSLLYLVSRSFEDHEETPLLGMEKHLVPALVTQRWSGNVRQLRCPGGMWDAASAATRATTHGGVDDDQAVRNAVASFIRSG